MRLLLATLVLSAAVAATTAAAVAPRGFEGRRCTPPQGHRVADCRIARHGTPDLSRAAWRALRGAESRSAGESTVSPPIRAAAAHASGR